MQSSKLYVGNLSFKTTADELRAHFEQFGAVTDVYIALDRMSGRPRGFAFVTMGTAEEAKVAAEKSNGVDLGGRQITVNEARPKEDRPAGGGFGGGERRGGFGGERRGFGGGSDQWNDTRGAQKLALEPVLSLGARFSTRNSVELAIGRASFEDAFGVARGKLLVELNLAVHL